MKKLSLEDIHIYMTLKFIWKHFIECNVMHLQIKWEKENNAKNTHSLVIYNIMQYG